jgi:hypothetical protein
MRTAPYPVAARTGWTSGKVLDLHLTRRGPWSHPRRTPSGEYESTRGSCGVVSRGPGVLMRRVVTLLERAPGREMTRKDLDAMLIAEGYYMQNVPRAIRSLSRRRLVFVKYGHSREESVVRLPQKVRFYSNDEIAAILKEIGGEQ